MKIGLSEVFKGDGSRDLGFVRAAAQLAEELGFDSLWYPEHVVFFPAWEDDYPYGVQGGAEVDVLRGVYEPFVALGFIAGVTSRIRLGTYVCVVAQRNPVLLARDVAAVDQLSGGRFDFGIGVGWARQEYEALGVPFERRGARTDEHLAAMKVLWSDDEVSEFTGELVGFEPLYAYPRPLQRPHPPILVGGNSTATIRRIVALGDGWLGYNLTVDQVSAFAERLASALDAAGRSLDEVTLRVGRRAAGLTEADWEADARYLDALQGTGVLDGVVVTPRIPTDGYEEGMQRYAEIVGVGAR